MKKTLALVLALAMVFSTITVAFAEDTLGADAQTCANLGMLKGETGTVDAAYVATAPSRLQAAIMFLRLKGLEAEALAFTGTENFADAGQVNWDGGKAIMAYLKANPQLGWQGDGTNFNPNNKITTQEYYKVMLEALGYKQTTPEVVGDFTYPEVLTFAASLGLTKVAEVASFTVNDLAIATVEALKLNVKGGEVTLAATLVEAGKIDKAAAIAAGLYVDAVTTTDAKLDSVSAIGNAVVLVEFDADVEKAFAENVDNYKIVEKGTSTEVEIKAAVLDATETTLAVLDTAALTAGKAYTLTVGDVSKNFAGVAKKTAAPEIDEVKGNDTERVTITFTTSMDMATALDTANYAIAGVTVESIEWDDADGDRDAVVLTTKGLVANKTYKVTVTNVKSADAVVLKSASKNFVSTTDKKAPKIDDDASKAVTNTRILLVFDDDNELTKESAEDLANYQITVGSTDTELDIVSAKLVEDKDDLNDNDDDDDMLVVELTTASQKSSQKYVVHVNNLVDTSVLANKMTKEDKVNVYGKRVDDDEPTFSKVEYLSDTLIQVTFKDDSRLDFASAQDINNYEVNNDVAVEKAEMQDPDDADCMKVRLTVSELGEDKSYKVTVNNVADEYGNAMENETKSASFDKAKVLAVATVDKIRVIDEKTVDIYFTKELDEASAEDVANYNIDDDIGTPRKATYDSDDKKVTLKTPEMVRNHKYDMEIDGVKDIADNVLTGIDVDFVVSLNNNDIDAPEIEDVEAVSRFVVRVTYNEAMDIGPAYFIKLDTNLESDGGDSDDDKTNDLDKVGYAASVAYDDDDMVVEYFFSAGDLTDTDVNLVVTNAQDAAGNVCEDSYEFSTIADDPEDVELLSWDQVNVKKFELQFSEKVRYVGSGATFTGGPNNKYTFTPKVDDDDDTLWYLNSNKIMDEDEEFKIDISSLFANYHGIPVIDEDDEYNSTFTGVTTSEKTTFETGIEDEEEPYMEEVVATNKREVKITFNEDMGYAGTYTISYTDDNGKDKTVSNSVDDLDENEVTLALGSDLEAKYVYTLAVKSQAKDLAGNRIDEDAEYDFAGTNVVKIANYIEGVKVINGRTFKVTSFAKLDPDETVAKLVYGSHTLFAAAVPAENILTEDANGNGNLDPGEDLNGNGILDTTVDDATTDTFTFAMPAGTALAAEVDYTVTLIDDNGTPNNTNDDSNIASYTFEGIVEDDISVADTATLGKYEISYSDSHQYDEVIVTVNGTVGAAIQVGGDDESVFVTGLTPTDKINVLVLRNGVALYYLNQFLVSDAE